MAVVEVMRTDLQLKMIATKDAGRLMINQHQLLSLTLDQLNVHSLKLRHQLEDLQLLDKRTIVYWMSHKDHVERGTDDSTTTEIMVFVRSLHTLAAMVTRIISRHSKNASSFAMMLSSFAI
jgi:hypothetical protein